MPASSHLTVCMVFNMLRAMMNPKKSFNKFSPLLSLLLAALFILFPIVSDASAEAQLGVLRGQVTINGEKVAHAVVALANQDGSAFPPSPMETTIVQEELQFSPAFSIVTPGTTISFENRDDNIHNVWSRSPSNPFDIGSHLPKTVKQVLLKNRGAVSLHCKVHVEMSALVYVSPSPFFAMTDKQGHFEIKDIPFGAYAIETWHASLAPKEMLAGKQLVEIVQKTGAVHLDLKSKAGTARNLIDISAQDWLPTIQEIEVALTKAFSSWQKKRMTSAASKVMTSQSRLYRGSGLRDAIANTLGEPRALDHELRFDMIRKWVQGITKPVTPSEVKQAIESLVTDLRKDVEVLEGL